MGIIIMVVLLILTIIAWRRGWRWKALYPLAVGFGVAYLDTWFGFVESLGLLISIVLIVWLLYMVIARPKFLKEQRRVKEIQKTLYPLKKKK